MPLKPSFSPDVGTPPPLPNSPERADDLAAVRDRVSQSLLSNSDPLLERVGELLKTHNGEAHAALQDFLGRFEEHNGDGQITFVPGDLFQLRNAEFDRVLELDDDGSEDTLEDLILNTPKPKKPSLLARAWHRLRESFEPSVPKLDRSKLEEVDRTLADSVRAESREQNVSVERAFKLSASEIDAIEPSSISRAQWDQIQNSSRFSYYDETIQPGSVEVRNWDYVAWLQCEDLSADQEFPVVGMFVAFSPDLQTKMIRYRAIRPKESDMERVKRKLETTEIHSREIDVPAQRIHQISDEDLSKVRPERIKSKDFNRLQSKSNYTVAGRDELDLPDGLKRWDYVLWLQHDDGVTKSPLIGMFVAFDGKGKSYIQYRAFSIIGLRNSQESRSSEKRLQNLQTRVDLEDFLVGTKILDWVQSEFERLNPNYEDEVSPSPSVSSEKPHLVVRQIEFKRCPDSSIQVDADYSEKHSVFKNPSKELLSGMNLGELGGVTPYEVDESVWKQIQEFGYSNYSDGVSVEEKEWGYAALLKAPDGHLVLMFIETEWVSEIPQVPEVSSPKATTSDVAPDEADENREPIFGHFPFDFTAHGQMAVGLEASQRDYYLPYAKEVPKGYLKTLKRKPHALAYSESYEGDVSDFTTVSLFRHEDDLVVHFEAYRPGESEPFAQLIRYGLSPAPAEELEVRIEEPVEVVEEPAEEGGRIMISDGDFEPIEDDGLDEYRAVVDSRRAGVSETFKRPVTGPVQLADSTDED